MIKKAVIKNYYYYFFCLVKPRNESHTQLCLCPYLNEHNLENLISNVTSPANRESAYQQSPMDMYLFGKYNIIWIGVPSQW